MKQTFEVLTLFPDAVSNFIATGLLGKAVDKGLIEVFCTNFRDFARDRHRTVDDTPFGGGAGMVIKPEPVVEAIEHVEDLRGPMHKVLLTPSAPRFDQAAALRLASKPRIGLLCGRYEGIDDRIREHYVDECYSIGDFVLGGGEVAALVVIEAVSRLAEGVLGNPESAVRESFSVSPHGALLEHPQYTRPAAFRGHAVPAVLQQGNHAEIEKWRLEQALWRTWTLRPDLRRGAPAPDVPWILWIPPAVDVDSRWIDLAIHFGLQAIAPTNVSRSRAGEWRACAGKQLEVIEAPTLKELRRAVRRRFGMEPWWVQIKDAKRAPEGAFVLGGAVWDRLRLLTGGLPGAVIVMPPAPDPVGLEDLSAWSSAVFAPILPAGTQPEGEKTRSEGLATEAAIADASRPSLQLAERVEHALAALRMR